MKKESWKKVLVVGVFAVAMAFLESVVVVYLRKLYYPGGFDFPLVGFIEPEILNIEWAREAFTIVMLACIGILTGRRFYEKFAYFLYAFAIWDIFYYVWLKACLDWPTSFLTWDLLFLIPLPWAGPILAPIICSLTMIFLAFVIINLQDRGRKFAMNFREWSLLVVGGLIILYTFLYDYTKLIINSGFAGDFLNLAKRPDFHAVISSYVPLHYSWLVFLIGEIFIVEGIFMAYFRNQKNEFRKI
jgi:hypothetical protein